jgi:dTDP-4-amino-4,6-dideoxygalactose transaminase
MIRLVDLAAQHKNLESDLRRAICGVFRESSFIGGLDNPYVRQFEERFADWLGVNEVVGCANGTDAIEIALRAADIGRGDEVIVPALTWIGTAEGVINAGATPVLVDVSPNTYTLDPTQVESAITERTRAVIPVHLYGQCADMHRIMDVARRHSLFVLEDCAQAHGARYDGRRAGTIGSGSIFSFYPGKNLGACGDAGCLHLRDVQLLRRARALANHGQVSRHYHQVCGRNSRLDGLQAAILSVKLPHIDEWNRLRGVLASAYYESLHDLDPIVRLPGIGVKGGHVFHLFVLSVRQRDQLRKYCFSRGIETGIHYPKSLASVDCIKPHLGRHAECAVADNVCKSLLSIPMYPELTMRQLSTVAAVLREGILVVTAHPSCADHAPAAAALGVARASRIAVRALRPLRRPVSTMEQSAA